MVLVFSSILLNRFFKAFNFENKSKRIFFQYFDCMGWSKLTWSICTCFSVQPNHRNIIYGHSTVKCILDDLHAQVNFFVVAVVVTLVYVSVLLVSLSSSVSLSHSFSSLRRNFHVLKINGSLARAPISLLVDKKNKNHTVFEQNCSATLGCCNTHSVLCRLLHAFFFHLNSSVNCLESEIKIA